MWRPRDIDEKTSRRASIGLLGGGLATALGLAPISHRQAHLDVEIKLLDYDTIDETDPKYGAINELQLRLSNQTSTSLDPLISTWTQDYKVRRSWRIADGPVPLKAGESAEYRAVANEKTVRLHTGTAQITVYQRGKEQWSSIHVQLGE